MIFTMSILLTAALYIGIIAMTEIITRIKVNFD